MNGFTYDERKGKYICCRCGSDNTSIKSGMMTDRITCENCGNEDYT